jgi:hypothetical protein
MQLYGQPQIPRAVFKETFGRSLRLFCTNLWNKVFCMRQKRFLIYLLTQLIVIVGVVVLFKVADEVKIASVEAGCLFVLLPLLLAWKEFQVAGLQRKWFYLGLLQFWLLFALPILGLRLTHWEAAFSDLSVLGVPGPVLHRFANSSYLMMMLLTAGSYFQKDRVVKPV